MFCNYAKGSFLGRVCSDIAVGNKDGKSYCRFSLVVNQDWKDKAGVVHEQALFINCTAFGKQSEHVSRFVKKKDRIYVEGQLTPNEYESKDGVKIKGFQLRLSNYQFIDYTKEDKAPAQKSSGEQKGDNPPPPSDADFAGFTADDIPF